MAYWGIYRKDLNLPHWTGLGVRYVLILFLNQKIGGPRRYPGDEKKACGIWIQQRPEFTLEKSTSKVVFSYIKYRQYHFSLLGVWYELMEIMSIECWVPSRLSSLSSLSFISLHFPSFFFLLSFIHGRFDYKALEYFPTSNINNNRTWNNFPFQILCICHAVSLQLCPRPCGL